MQSRRLRGKGAHPADMVATLPPHGLTTSKPEEPAARRMSAETAVPRRLQLLYIGLEPFSGRLGCMTVLGYFGALFEDAITGQAGSLPLLHSESKRPACKTADRPEACAALLVARPHPSWCNADVCSADHRNSYSRAQRPRAINLNSDPTPDAPTFRSISPLHPMNRLGFIRGFASDERISLVEDWAADVLFVV